MPVVKIVSRHNNHGPRLEYVAGRRVVPNRWDADWHNECSAGIHFYITRLEAEEH